MESAVMRWLAWSGALVGGTLLAFVDWRWIKRPVAGLFLVSGVVGGVIVTNVSPFTFAGGDYYMQGVVIAGGSTLALAGYVLAAAVRFVCRRVGGP